MRYLTEYKRVEGLGAAHSGTDHFISQRISAAALIVLLPLFLIFVGPLIGEPIEVVQAGFGSFWTSLIAGLTAVFVGLHVAQGLQVVIEDYTHGATRVLLLTAMRVGTASLVAAALFALVLLTLS